MPDVQSEHSIVYLYVVICNGLAVRPYGRRNTCDTRLSLCVQELTTSLSLSMHIHVLVKSKSNLQTRISRMC